MRNCNQLAKLAKRVTGPISLGDQYHPVVRDKPIHDKRAFCRHGVECVTRDDLKPASPTIVIQADTIVATSLHEGKSSTRQKKKRLAIADLQATVQQMI